MTKNTNFWRNLVLTAIVIITIIIGLNEFHIIDFNNSNTANSAVQSTQLSQVNMNSRMSYGRLLDYIDLGWVKQVDLYNNSRSAIIKASSPLLGDRLQTIRVQLPVNTSQLIQKLKEYNIDFDAHAIPKSNFFIELVNELIFPIIFVIILLGFLLYYAEILDGSSPLNIIQSVLKVKSKPNTGIYFDDIAGIDEAKAQFEEIVSFLKEPEKYTKLGAKIPKGILVVGPPGTGKTLLAKAIATEAKVPFFNISGAEFVEMFVGVGAGRVRNLFRQASKNAPSIIFIDEIDAIGRERGIGIGNGNDEREQTLNQLLTEMDGFKENKGVIVVAATNRADILDKALLRPGRFTRQITVGLPDYRGRTNILKVHARNKPFTEDVSLEKVARRTPGFSGADLANILNEAGILAVRYSKSAISSAEIDEAINRRIGGIGGSRQEEDINKILIAYHEVGHAIAASVSKSHDEVDQITIKPRGKAKSSTWYIPSEDQTLLTRSALLAQIITALGGRAAERVVFGRTDVTTNATNDIQRVTTIARQIVTSFGMSKIGPIALDGEDSQEDDNTMQPVEYSPELMNRIDREILNIIHCCEKMAVKIILDNRIIIDILVEKLLEVETLDGEEFRKILRNYTVLPDKNIPYVSVFPENLKID